jgi:hypothetical protein
MYDWIQQIYNRDEADFLLDEGLKIGLGRVSITGYKTQSSLPSCKF